MTTKDRWKNSASHVSVRTGCKYMQRHAERSYGIIRARKLITMCLGAGDAEDDDSNARGATDRYRSVLCSPCSQNTQVCSLYLKQVGVRKQRWSGVHVCWVSCVWIAYIYRDVVNPFCQHASIQFHLCSP